MVLRGTRRTSIPVLVAWLLLLPVTAHAGIGDEALAKSQAFLQRLEAGATAEEFVKVANELGPVIDELRQSDVPAEKLREVRDVIANMWKATQRKLTDTETEAGESEAALERLYRSQTWDDLSFSLAAFPYWRAWVDLELARRIDDEGLKSKALLPARKGFRSASMQLFRPGLVYGGWLGLGYVEMERGRHARALEIFQQLEQALSSEPDHPIRQAVNLELRLLEARTGQVKDRRRGRALDDAELQILRAEAFALLQQSRKSGGRPLEAAERLRTIIEAGRVDQQLLSDMLHFAQELSGVNVGPYTDLMGAEFAMEYEHWYNAMQKYEKFFSEVIAPPGLDLSRFRYRWALAAYKAEIFQPAVGILEKLVRRKDLDPELDTAASKLLYATYAAREQKGGSAVNRKSLRTAAQRFIRKSPNDPAADSARLMMAQTASNANAALKQLGQVSSPSKLGGEVERTAFLIVAREFSEKIVRGKDGAAAGLAKQGIQAWTKLPTADKKVQANFAVLMQMRALVTDEPAKVLEQLDEIEKKTENMSMDIRRALVWSRLKLYDRLGDAAAATAYVQRLAADGIPSWQVEYLYPWIAARSAPSERLALARLIRPAIADQPEMDRRVRAMVIEALLATDEVDAGYDEALDFAKVYPSSGDAWRLLAKASEASEQPFEADRAWGVITNKAVPTMPIWWEGMLSRVRIRSGSTRPEAACELLAQIEQHREYLPADRHDELARVQAAAPCAVAEKASP